MSKKIKPFEISLKNGLYYIFLTTVRIEIALDFMEISQHQLFTLCKTWFRCILSLTSTLITTKDKYLVYFLLNWFARGTQNHHFLLTIVFHGIFDKTKLYHDFTFMLTKYSSTAAIKQCVISVLSQWLYSITLRTCILLTPGISSTNIFSFFSSVRDQSSRQ